MKIIYSKACGIDVYKRFIVAVICDSSSAQPKYIRKRSSTFNNQLITSRNWLLEYDCQNVYMESTGKYYIPVYNVLIDFIFNIVVANPKWGRAIEGKKNDNKDSRWINDLFKISPVRSSYIPDKIISILRELIRYQYKLINTRSSKKNRFKMLYLNVGNCKIDMIFSDVFDKSASSIVNLVLSNNDYMKIFFQKFMADAKHIMMIFSMPLKEHLLMIIKKQEYPLLKNTWNMSTHFLMKFKCSLMKPSKSMRALFNFFVLFQVLMENPPSQSFLKLELTCHNGHRTTN